MPRIFDSSFHYFDEVIVSRKLFPTRLKRCDSNHFISFIQATNVIQDLDAFSKMRCIGKIQKFELFLKDRFLDISLK